MNFEHFRKIFSWNGRPAMREMRWKSFSIFTKDLGQHKFTKSNICSLWHFRKLLHINGLIWISFINSRFLISIELWLSFLFADKRHIIQCHIVSIWNVTLILFYFQMIPNAVREYHFLRMNFQLQHLLCDFSKLISSSSFISSFFFSLSRPVVGVQTVATVASIHIFGCIWTTGQRIRTHGVQNNKTMANENTRDKWCGCIYINHHIQNEMKYYNNVSFGSFVYLNECFHSTGNSDGRETQFKA